MNSLDLSFQSKLHNLTSLFSIILLYSYKLYFIIYKIHDAIKVFIYFTHLFPFIFFFII